MPNKFTVAVNESYVRVEELWTKGLNPTLKAILYPTQNTPLENKKSSLNYFNFNNKDTCGCIKGNFVVTDESEGSVEEGHNGALGKLELSSEGFTPTFFFSECAKKLTELIRQTIEENGNGKYTLSISIFADLLLESSSSNINAMQFGGGSQGKVYGTSETCEYNPSNCCVCE